MNEPLYGPEVYDRIAELWALGVLTTEIGRRLHIPKNSICRMTRDARLRGDERFPARQPGTRNVVAKVRAPAPARPRRRPPKMARVRKPPVPVSAPTRVNPPRIWELRARECRYPITSDPHGEHRFCAAPTRADKVYCETHDALCNQQPQPARKRVR